MQSKPLKSTERSHPKHLKEQQKLKLKLKDSSNPDSFNKLFEAQDLIVVNRAKQPNPAKVKEEHSVKRIKQEPNIKTSERKHLTPLKMVKESSIEHQKKNMELFSEEMITKKSRPIPIKQEERVKIPIKDNRQNNKPNALMPDANSKSISTGSKMKLPEKTMPEQKKNRESESTKVSGQKSKKSNANVFIRAMSQSSSSESEHGSAFSKSSSDCDIDHEMFKPKKKVETLHSIDQAKVGVRQLFGDGSDDDDDQMDDIGDIFSSLKNPGKKVTGKSQV